MKVENFKQLNKFNKLSPSTMKKISGGNISSIKFGGYKSNDNFWSWLLGKHK